MTQTYSAHQSPSIGRYMKEVGQFMPLNSTDEVELARQARRGSGAAKERLLKANLRFVIRVAKEYQGQGLPLEDLISEGNLGLMKAAESYDESRGFKFISYAVWWIRQNILKALADHSRMLRMPMNRIDQLNKMRKVSEVLSRQDGKEASLSAIAEYMHLRENDLANLLQASAPTFSLQKPLRNQNGNTLLDVCDGHLQQPDAAMMRESQQHEVSALLATLEPREAEIIRLYFGLNSDRSLTLEEIGVQVGLTRERVRQIKEKALKRLQRRVRALAFGDSWT